MMLYEKTIKCCSHFVFGINEIEIYGRRNFLHDTKKKEKKSIQSMICLENFLFFVWYVVKLRHTTRKGSEIVERWLLIKGPLLVYSVVLIICFLMMPPVAVFLLVLSLPIVLLWLLFASWVCREYDKSEKFNHRR